MKNLNNDGINFMVKIVGMKSNSIKSYRSINKKNSQKVKFNKNKWAQFRMKQ